ncbi:hypothetical protein ACHAXA_010662 [Cyclostephanos tholiformis]|uniref:Alpha-type protein kinase domain-containing protein n=1 Tax=Cyclostephanos tholiformis TaxID=382380 RepID=A0ABD3RSR9_9STRA
MSIHGMSFPEKRVRSPLNAIDDNPSHLRAKRAKEGNTAIDLTGDDDINYARNKVKFSQGEPIVHYFDPQNGHRPQENGNRLEDCSANEASGSGWGRSREGVPRISRLNDELSLLSTLHGRARRELRDISKHDFRTVVQYGTKTKTWGRKGEQRWKFEFGTTVCITDFSCCTEITCYKKAISIEPAKINERMLENHARACRILRDDPHLVTTHSIIVIDQSASMASCDVNSFRSRSDAAYGTLALDYIAEQLYQMNDEFFVDSVTIIEMSDGASLFVEKEPLDWILFNKILNRLSTARPRSHGNYLQSLELAERRIQMELKTLDDLDADDIPAFMLVFISDGKPSDCQSQHEEMRHNVIARLAQKLKSKLTFFGMGVGAPNADFDQLRLLADAAKEYGAQGLFNHAGLNPASLSTSFSSLATSMTSTRADLYSTINEKQTKTEKCYQMKQKINDYGLVPLRRETNLVSRHQYDPKNLSNVWPRVDFFNPNCAGFDIEKDPFGKGAERLAFMFHEIKRKSTGRGWEQVGCPMVAKESRFIEDEESKEAFHLSFCRVQNKSNELAKLFNQAVERAPLLRPSTDEVSLPPPIVFLDCSVYEYTNFRGMKCGLLLNRLILTGIEKYLNGKFTKFNSNNGFANNANRDGASIILSIGEVKLTDFVQSFSHWVYESTGHNMIVCDLQGILDMEGRRPVFRLTDPAICSKWKKDRHGCSAKNRYGKTDLGMRGIRDFCCRHICNSVCKALNLPTMRAK